MKDTFFFGRLNYTSNYKLYDLLTHGNKYRPKQKDIRYGIFEVNKIDDPDLGVILTGELVKYQDVKEEPVVKEDKLSKEYVEGVISGKSRFFLLEKSHLIAYNPYGKVIGQKAFCDAFSGVIIGADDTFNVDSQIHPVNMEYEFMSALKTMKTLNRLVLNLTPSNPNSRDIWKDIDERLNEMNVKKYREEMTASDNQSIGVDQLTERKINMAQDGYGNAKGHGKDADGNDVTISTDSKDSIMKKNIDINLTLSQQLAQIKTVFQKVLDRFKK